MRLSCLRTVILLALLASDSVSAQTVRYVDADATGANNGTSWTNAYTELMPAIIAAASDPNSVDVIHVAEGTYRPDTTGLVDPREATFDLQPNTEILGGFAGVGAADPDQRDTGLFVTTLSGDIGVPGLDTDNCYHVVTATSDPDTAILDGFRIRKGWADGTGFPDDAGAGLLVVGSAEPIIRNCFFRVNESAGSGGAVRIIDSSPRFEDCVFANNEAAAGGAVYCNQITLPNEAEFWRCRFKANEAANSGGAFYCGDADALLVDCLFIENESGFNGGGFEGWGGEPRLFNCGFYGNMAAGNAGGGLFITGSTMTIVNPVFSGNEAGGVGGGLASQGTSDLTVVNATLAHNASTTLGGGLYVDNGTLALSNSILFSNLDAAGANDESAQLHLGPNVTLTFNHNDVQGLTGSLGGVGNFDDDPLFVDADGGDNLVGTDDDDLKLQPTSPCIDVGDNYALPQDSADLDSDGDTVEATPLDCDGVARVQDHEDTPDAANGSFAIVDMGAFEIIADCDGNGLADSEEMLADAGLDCDANGILDGCEDDADGDGSIDACDVCTGDDAVGDADGDGQCDDVDLCPNDAAKTSPGSCGCGSEDTDSDGDGVPDCDDACPGGDDAVDADGNGVPDACDAGSAPVPAPTSGAGPDEAALDNGAMCGTCGEGATLSMAMMFTGVTVMQSRRRRRQVASELN